MAMYARVISGVIGGINSYVQIIMKTFHSILEDAKFSVHWSLKDFRAKSNDIQDV